MHLQKSVTIYRGNCDKNSVLSLNTTNPRHYVHFKFLKYNKNCYYISLYLVKSFYYNTLENSYLRKLQLIKVGNFIGRTSFMVKIIPGILFGHIEKWQHSGMWTVTTNSNKESIHQHVYIKNLTLT